MRLSEITIPPAVSAAAERLDALTLRERALIIVTALTLVTVGWYVLVLEPLIRQADESRVALYDLQQGLMSANESLEAQLIRLAGDESSQVQSINTLQRQIDELNSALGNYNAQLIEPAEMASMLERMLEQQSSLDLIRVRNLPAETLRISDEEDAPVFFRHGLEMEVEGSYADCVAYLQAVEDLPWRLYWQMIDIESLDYPNNRIRIEVSTLSLDEAWIGA